MRIARTAVALADDDVAARPVLASAQDAGSSFSGVSASKVADTTRQILNAVSFPRFVTELINGVFKALNESNQQQLHSYIELIQNVATTTESFADANVGVSGARTWLAERFPASFVVQGDQADDFAQPASSMSPEDRAAAQAERDASTRLRLVPGGSMPSDAAMKTALGLGPQDSVPSGDPEGLVGLARASLARSRQQMLSTMVMMGLQRIVIESGRLTAAMRFHIDTRSAAADDRGSSFDMRNEVDAHGGANYGLWNVDATLKNTIGYVSTQRTQTTEEMNTDLDLNSSVELLFKTDYVALDRLAGGPAQERIRVNALNPEAEERLATADRTARRAAQATAEAGRSSQLNERLHSPPAIPPPVSAPARGSSPAGPAGSGGGGAAGTGAAGAGAVAPGAGAGAPSAGGATVAGSTSAATASAGGGAAANQPTRAATPATGTSHGSPATPPR